MYSFDIINILESLVEYSLEKVLTLTESHANLTVSVKGLFYSNGRGGFANHFTSLEILWDWKKVLEQDLLAISLLLGLEKEIYCFFSYINGLKTGGEGTYW